MQEPIPQDIDNILEVKVKNIDIITLLVCKLQMKLCSTEQNKNKRTKKENLRSLYELLPIFEQLLLHEKSISIHILYTYEISA